MTDKAIEVAQPQAIDRPVTDPAARAAVVDELEAQVLLIQEAMNRALVKGVHYGLIPGTQKPSLWQPGAEMLCQMFRFQTDLTRTDQYEDWDKGVFSYTYKCRLMNRNGELITEREATCSSMEPNYKSKNAYQQRETLMQMAQKRAYVSVVKGSAAASAIFSMDDDIVPKQQPNRSEEQYGICKVHDVPFFQSTKMKKPMHPYKNPAGGKDLWCDLWMAATDPTDEARVKAMEALEALVGKGQAHAQERATYAETVLGKPAGSLTPRDVTLEEWIRVTEMAEGDLASKNSEPPVEDPNYEAPTTLGF